MRVPLPLSATSEILDRPLQGVTHDLLSGLAEHDRLACLRRPRLRRDLVDVTSHPLRSFVAPVFRHELEQLRHELSEKRAQLCRRHAGFADRRSSGHDCEAMLGHPRRSEGVRARTDARTGLSPEGVAGLSPLRPRSWPLQAFSVCRVSSRCVWADWRSRVQISAPRLLAGAFRAGWARRVFSFVARLVPCAGARRPP
jgi:hypothetical protein